MTDRATSRPVTRSTSRHTPRGSSRTRAVTRDDLGAWLVKANPALSPVAEMSAVGFAGVDGWCVRRSYRTTLVTPGDRVLLWVSGDGRLLPPGIHAAGEVTAPVVADHEGPRGAPSSGQPVDTLPIRLRPVDRVATREELAAHPLLRGLEVLRSPWGSNPSAITRAELAALTELGLRI